MCRRADERGFAMLLVFLFASLIAISLYLEMPRIALESQRQKEQLLIDRGEQYKRAIQLFYKKAGRYPGDLKELESFQNQRFLRRRYVDPMTGKDEWRLIHINNGVLTDSLLNKAKGQDDKNAASSTLGQYVGVQAGMGDMPTGPAQGGISARDRRRPSDNQPMPGMGGAPGAGGQNLDPNSGLPPGQATGPGGNPQQPLPYQGGFVPPGQQANAPGQAPGFPNQPPTFGQPPQPGQSPFMGQPGQMNGPTPYPIQQQPNQNPNSGNTGGSYISVQPGLGSSAPYVGGGAVTGSTPNNPGQVNYPGQMYPGQMYPGQPGPPVNSQTGGVSPYPTQGVNPTPVPFGQPGMNTQASGTAADMINRILTTPRPGGMPTGGAIGNVIGGGIAGVASTSEGEGVKVYNERTLYKEWEFIFDPSKVKPIQNPNAVTGTPGGTPASQIGTPLNGPTGMTNPDGSTFNPNQLQSNPLSGAPPTFTGPGGAAKQ